MKILIFLSFFLLSLFIVNTNAQETTFKRDNSSGRIYKWRINSETISNASFFTNNNGVVVQSTATNAEKMQTVEIAAENAFNFWSNLTGVVFAHALVDEEADITIQFSGSVDVNDGFGNAANLSFIDLSVSVGWTDNSIIAGQLYGGVYITNLHFAIAHEIGHSMKYIGHSFTPRPASQSTSR